MKRNLIFALVFALTVLLAGCNGTVPPVTAEPTRGELVESTAVIPTEVPPTAVPSPTPAAVPTEVPTTTPTEVPTEVPMYIGLPANEVEALRAQCLQENPNSLCLPLPVDPTSGSAVSEETWQNEMPWPDGTTKTLLGSHLVIRGEGGITLLSPLNGGVSYERNGDGPGDLRPDRTFWLIFRWDSGFEIWINRPNLQQAHSSFPIADAEITLFGGDEPRQEFGSRATRLGTHVVTIVGEGFELFLLWGERPSFPGDPDNTVREGIWVEDLLRDSHGSIIYLLSE